MKKVQIIIIAALVLIAFTFIKYKNNYVVDQTYNEIKNCFLKQNNVGDFDVRYKYDFESEELLSTLENRGFDFDYFETTEYDESFLFRRTSTTTSTSRLETDGYEFFVLYSDYEELMPSMINVKGCTLAMRTFETEKFRQIVVHNDFINLRDEDLEQKNIFNLDFTFYHYDSNNQYDIFYDIESGEILEYTVFSKDGDIIDSTYYKEGISPEWPIDLDKEYYEEELKYYSEEYMKFLNSLFDEDQSVTLNGSIEKTEEITDKEMLSYCVNKEIGAFESLNKEKVQNYVTPYGYTERDDYLDDDGKGVFHKEGDLGEFIFTYSSNKKCRFFYDIVDEEFGYMSAYMYNDRHTGTKHVDIRFHDYTVSENSAVSPYYSYNVETKELVLNKGIDELDNESCRRLAQKISDEMLKEYDTILIP